MIVQKKLTELTSFYLKFVSICFHSEKCPITQNPFSKNLKFLSSHFFKLFFRIETIMVTSDFLKFLLEVVHFIEISIKWTISKYLLSQSI